MVKDFGGIEIELEFSLKDLEKDLSTGGSARFDWWLDDEKSSQLFQEIIPKFRWDPSNLAQSQHTLLRIVNAMAFSGMSAQNIRDHDWGVPRGTIEMIDDLFHVLKGEPRDPSRPNYDQLDLIQINLEILSTIDEIQQKCFVRTETVEYLNGLGSLSRAKNHYDDDYSMVDLYLTSRDFSFLLAQIDFISDSSRKGTERFLQFLDKNIDLQHDSPVPYPNSIDEYQVLMAFTSEPPKVLHIPFMKHVDPRVWHHVYLALKRRILR